MRHRGPRRWGHVDPASDAAARRRKRRRKKSQARCAPARRRRKAQRQACVRRIKPRRRRGPELQPVPPAPAAPGPPGLRLDTPLAVYSGPFGAAQAERLLWRAGFGPSPGWISALAAMGLDAAVESLIAPAGQETFTGAEPTDSSGNPLAPEDGYGHDHNFWLDRMVRTDQPFVQR